MPEQENLEGITQKLASAMVQFRRLKSFPMEQKREGEEKQIRHSEVMILFAIRDLVDQYPEGVSISELGEYLRIKSPTVTPAVYNLEQENLVERSIDQKDRRVIRVRLTKQGNRFIEAHVRRFLGQIQGLVTYLGEEKSNTLAELLNEVFEYGSEHPPCQKK